MENEVKNNFNNGNSWWKPVMIFYVKTMSWIIIPLILGIILGKYVGKSTGNQVLFFAIIIFSFLITCFGIYREIKKYKNDLEKNGKQ